MLIRGRLIVTANGFLLDELRSLLQKSLRRKDRDLVFKATKELIGCGKDQLPWKSLISFLFQDHCLSDLGILEEMLECYKTKNKLRAVELLFECYTCRVAACLPVITLDKHYYPDNFDYDLKVDVKYQGLLQRTAKQIDIDLVMANFIKVWKEGKAKKTMMTLFKLMTMVQDIMAPEVTQKGKDLLLKPVKKNLGVTHVVLSVLYNITTDEYLKKYIYQCFELSAIPEVCHRLIFFCVLTQRIYIKKGQVKELKNIAEKLGQVDLKDFDKLDSMPSWAVDKHTYRGRSGKSTDELVKNQKKRPKDMSDEALKEFHGVRPKVDLHHYFVEGDICKNPMLDSNPYLERTKEIYFNHKPRMQKTAKMTGLYYREIIKRYPKMILTYKTLDESPLTEEDIGSEESTTDIDNDVQNSTSSNGVPNGKRKLPTEPCTSASFTKCLADDSDDAKYDLDSEEDNEPPRKLKKMKMKKIAGATGTCKDILDGRKKYSLRRKPDNRLSVM